MTSTDYNALAQRIVEKGVGRYDAIAKNLLWPPGASQYVPGAKAFCNDGRVVLALMEKVIAEGGWMQITKGKQFLVSVRDKKWRADLDSLAVAICEACVEALEVSDE